MSNLLVAGSSHTWKIQAKDLYQNVVLDSNERFSLEIKDLHSGEVHIIDAVYRFKLYETSFSLARASSYSAIVRLIQRGGLVATYYRTTDYQAAYEQVESHDHD